MSVKRVVVAGVRWGDALQAVTERLRACGVEEASRDARLLARRAAGGDADPLVDLDARLGDEAAQQFARMADARAARAPMAQVLGSQGFWTLDVVVTPDVLTPRPETEHLVEALLDAGAPERARALDLGVGSGAVLAALLTERPGWFGVGVDRSIHALGVAAQTLAATGVADRAALLAGDWAAPLADRFDIVACNPPYVRASDIARLDPEVRDHEPRLALDGGADGLDAYRRIAARLPQLLTSQGVAAFEVGFDQSDAVKKIFMEVGLQVQHRYDLAGVQRVVEARRADPHE